ncbi:MAG: hypothetical protein C5B49_10755 [Bdellovibrio sp.]|nr:MAG: hypothetical protein C5B49_10755 [Bdellovibrio sp.]
MGLIFKIPKEQVECQMEPFHFETTTYHKRNRAFLLCQFEMFQIATSRVYCTVKRFLLPAEKLLGSKELT